MKFIRKLKEVIKEYLRKRKEEKERKRRTCGYRMPPPSLLNIEISKLTRECDKERELRKQLNRIERKLNKVINLIASDKK